VIDVDTSLSARELQNGLEALNQLSDQWNAQAWSVPALFRYEFPLVTGTQTYTIGPGATIDIQAPIRLDEGQVYLKQTDGLETIMKEKSQKDWANIYIKSLTGRPSSFYYEKLLPFSRINIYPINLDAYSLVFYIEQLLAQITSAESQFTLKQAYAKALTYNLAVDLKPEYPAATLDPAVLLGASDSLADLKRVNTVIPVMRCESGMNTNNEDFRREEFGIA